MPKQRNQSKKTRNGVNRWSQLHKGESKRINDLLEKYGFFAFDDKQFDEELKKLGLTRANAQERLTSIGMGGYLLKEHAKEYVNFYKELVRKEKQLLDSDKTGDGAIYEMMLNEFYQRDWGYVHPLDILEEAGVDVSLLNTDPRYKHAYEKAVARFDKMDKQRTSAEDFLAENPEYRVEIYKAYRDYECGNPVMDFDEDNVEALCGDKWDAFCRGVNAEVNWNDPYMELDGYENIRTLDEFDLERESKNYDTELAEFIGKRSDENPYNDEYEIYLAEIEDTDPVPCNNRRGRSAPKKKGGFFSLFRRR